MAKPDVDFKYHVHLADIRNCSGGGIRDTKNIYHGKVHLNLYRFRVSFAIAFDKFQFFKISSNERLNIGWYVFERINTEIIIKKYLSCSWLVLIEFDETNTPI